jgi:hypothetical protein
MQKNFWRKMLVGAIVLVTPLSVKADTRICGNPRAAVQDRLTVVGSPSSCPRGSQSLVKIPDIYGDGSSGSLRVDSTRLLDGIGREYQQITIERGTVLRMRSGSMLRCLGTLLNNGTIEILPGAFGASRFFTTDTPLAPGGRLAHPGGVAAASASDGLISYSSLARSGPGIPDRAPGTTFLLRLPAFGGGGGGSGMTTDSSQEQVGGMGGGSAQIFCRAGIVNRGTIIAVGEGGGPNGGGGGAGGLLLLGSTGVVTNRGTISVAGGNGAPAAVVADGSIAVAAGGGGAGGHLQIIAARFENSAGEVFVTGGVAGSSSASATSASMRVGGGQGGSLFARGGRGGSVAAEVFESAEDGADGDVNVLEAGPTDLPIGY